MLDLIERAANRFLHAASGAGLVMLAIATPTWAQSPSAEEIQRALAPKQPLTRGLSAPAPKPEEQQFVNTLRNRSVRSLTVDEKDKIATIAKDKPKIDLEINFDFNSAEIGAKALPSANALGKALSAADLKNSTFVVAGYTDAKGAEGYNQDLSERRAEAIKRFLTEKHGINASNLVIVGYGETRLKNQKDPNSGENRRVQVVNMTEK
jgi:outer membrane protein OmpA-like peptidoglycan-associated protein